MNKLAWLLTVTALSLLLSLLWFEPKTCQNDLLLSCFNQRAIDPNQDWSHYSFVALGHIRTGPKQQGPNRNLKRNFGRIFADEPAFVIALGDLYYSISEKSIANIKQWTSQNIPIPVFNAVGNHDTQTYSGHDSALYASAFGNPSFDFILGSELYIFLENGKTPILRRSAVWALTKAGHHPVVLPTERAIFDSSFTVTISPSSDATPTWTTSRRESRLSLKSRFGGVLEEGKTTISACAS